MATHLVNGSGPTSLEKRAMIVTQEFKMFYLAALTGLCADSEVEQPAERASVIAQKAMMEVDKFYLGTVARMKAEEK